MNNSVQKKKKIEKVIEEKKNFCPNYLDNYLLCKVLCFFSNFESFLLHSRPHFVWPMRVDKLVTLFSCVTSWAIPAVGQWAGCVLAGGISQFGLFPEPTI